jgi:Ca2+-binding EF-hand superfamily protein
MKKPLVLTATVAGLFLALGLPGQETMMGENPGQTEARETVPSEAKAPARQLSRAEEVLKRFDKNRDGKLDEDERADAHEVMLQEQTAKSAKAVSPGGPRGFGPFQATALELFDRNRDQQLDAAERLRASAFLQQHDEALRQVTLTRFDKNTDGRLDETERHASQNFAAEQRGELMRDVLLKHYDANANGQLDAGEKVEIQKGLEEMGSGARGRSAKPVAASDAQAEAESPGEQPAVPAEIERRRASREGKPPVATPAD